MVDPNEKRRLVQQLINDFKSRDGGLMYSLEPMKWNSYFEKQAEQLSIDPFSYETETDFFDWEGLLSRKKKLLSLLKELRGFNKELHID